MHIESTILMLILIHCVCKVTSDWIMSKVCDGIFCDILSEIRCHHSLAGVLFYAAHSTCRFVQIVQFFNRKMNKCIRMGITAIKFVIWGGKSAVLRSQITFYGSADVSP